MAEIRVHIDTLEYTRQGLKTRDPINLQVGSHSRVVLVRPERQRPVAATYGCFPSDLSFPGPAFLSLLLHPHRTGTTAFPLEQATGHLQVFAHTDATGSEASNKTLSDQRARVAFAFLTADLETVLEVAASESWATPHDQVMLRCLECDPGPIDGVHEELTEAATTRFQENYNSGKYHQPEDRPLKSDLQVDGDLGSETFEALLDAYVHLYSPRLPESKFLADPAIGCAAFNPATDDDTAAVNRRISLVIHGNAPTYPDAAPCTAGDPEVCPIVAADALAQCMWYREHVQEAPVASALHHNFSPSWLPLTNGKYLLSVLTTVPNGDEVVFEVFASEDRVTTPERRPTEVVEPWPSAEITSVVEHGVAQVVWDPPPQFTPGPDGRVGGVVPGFAASHEGTQTVAHASYPAHVITILLARHSDGAAAPLDGKLVLSDTSGTEVVFEAGSEQSYDDAHDAFRLEGASEHESYTLVHEREGHPQVVYFERIPFADLGTHGGFDGELPDEPDAEPELEPLSTSAEEPLL